ncbi:MAG TPA: helix-turn-helix domain-containing protein [Acidimicrobiales bacterium]
MRSYEQNCPIAVALDAIGDRWSLLILRELAMGDQRFTDLRRSLPGIAPNLLSARLTELADRGLVARAELPPPAARTVYRLTPRGREVTPVLGALSRFGAADLPADPARPMRPSRAVHSLLLPWHRPAASRLDRVRVVVDGSAFDLVTGDGGVRVERVDTDAGAGDEGRAAAPDLTVETTTPALVAARRDRTPLAATYAGPAAARAAFTEAFALPT